MKTLLIAGGQGTRIRAAMRRERSMSEATLRRRFLRFAAWKGDTSEQSAEALARRLVNKEPALLQAVGRIVQVLG